MVVERDLLARIASSRPYGGCSSMAERLPVKEDVVGSSPTNHPSALVVKWISRLPSEQLLGVRIPPGAPERLEGRLNASG